MPGLANIRRLEAAAFRAWPATSVHHEGTWSVRLTASHPSRRLNSVNPLDPNDNHDIPARVERVSRKFRDYGRTLTFRQSPLAPAELSQYLSERKFERIGHSLVMSAPISKLATENAFDQIPLQDIGRYVDASILIHEHDSQIKPGLSEVISAIKPTAGMFVLEDDDGPVSSVICVQDGNLAGILDMGTRVEQKRQGKGRRLLAAALKWARSRGADMAWLQVESDNEAATRMYESLGFEPSYSYFYLVRPEPRS
jgi:ribosomal protein S18 acetylase RimI-like enzyme